MTYRLKCTINLMDTLTNSGKGGGPLLGSFIEALISATPLELKQEDKTINEVTFLIESDTAPAKEPFVKAAKRVSDELKVKEAVIQLVPDKEEAGEVKDFADSDESDLFTDAPGETGEERKAGDQSDAGDQEEADKTSESSGVSSEYEAIMNMVGIDEIKAWASQIEQLKPDEKNKKSFSAALTGMSYLLAIDPGFGCSTILERMNALLAKKIGRNGKMEENTPEIAEKDEWALFTRLAESGGRSYMSDPLVFAIHLDHFLSKTNSDRFTEIIRKLNKRENQVIVFVVPYLEDRELKKIRENIDDVMPCRILRVRPFTEKEYISLYRVFFEDCGMKLEDGTDDLLLKKISYEKSDGRFYGVETVKKISEEIIYEKLVNGRNSDVITAQDVAAVLPEEENKGEELSGEEQLDRLIALTEVKARIKEICATIAWEKEHAQESRRSMHMIFSGAPGTGKTAVARIVGKMLKETGVLKRGEFFEVSRKDLVGSYVGHTAPKTAGACQMAYGSVLFIDEAYALAAGGERDFGPEAISTLIAEMENNRSRLVVIFAGYEHELDKLFQLNPGLRDRIPYHLQFPNYTREELKKIFFLMIPDKFTYDDAFRAHAGDYFDNLSDAIMNDEHFSNARFVRNIVERVISKATLRLADLEGEDACKLVASDFDLAAADAEFRGLSKKKHTSRIGF